MRAKIIAAVSIFVVLFSGAWLVNETGKREFYIPGEADEIVEMMPVESVENIMQAPLEKQKIEAFQSREYVRIKKAS
ncbi:MULTISPECIES: hypothetical protein [Bacillaceae]|uniref:Uncharacterized protein n=1 Tax=Bacillus mesophilum TaxID=1071718 RepID=A0A7V7RMA8_9BACI|nr:MULTISPECIES: hypothetical protein [Bacillaceae]KAB2332979.1 hypothetical protein F7732_12960 [Bacillus mesophilum]